MRIDSSSVYAAFTQQQLQSKHGGVTLVCDKEENESSNVEQFQCVRAARTRAANAALAQMIGITVYFSGQEALAIPEITEKCKALGAQSRATQWMGKRTRNERGGYSFFR